ncbi:MAG: dihydrofolate reductase [Bacteroidota bacterium]|nr:dihydrofolate reductase [Bacteroidota bacterium]MDP4250684.1 dihydrofolate reductase [Bacteroidota bacterium]
MKLSIIVAAAENNVIGKSNQMVWYLPEDFRFFKNSTWGLPLIMGRKTYEAMGAKNLAGRFNIIITRQKGYLKEHPDIQTAGSLAEAIDLAKQTDAKEAFIGGGGQLYAESILLCDKIYITRVKAILEGDAFFPEIPGDVFELTHSRIVPADEKNAYSMDFQTWEKKKHISP